MDLAPMWEQIQGMLDYVLILTPNLIVGLTIFVLFVLVARGLRKLAIRLSEERRRQRNLGMVLGRLAYGTAIFLGGMVALTIVFPSFSPADMLGALGVGGIVVGFAFRDIAQNFLAGILHSARKRIDLPFPTQQILFHDQTEESDGDRRRQREGWPVGAGDEPQPRSIAAAISGLALNGLDAGREPGAGRGAPPPGRGQRR